MKYLLDTCVISELASPKPKKKVVDWILNENEDNLCISVLTFGELYKGIEKLTASTKKERLHDWVENDLKTRFSDRIIAIDLNIATIWGKIQGAAQQQGRPMPAVDALIAATGIAYNLTVVTRNTPDMEVSGVRLLNLWK